MSLSLSFSLSLYACLQIENSVFNWLLLNLLQDFDGSDEEIEEEPTLVLRVLDDDDEEDVAVSNPVEEEVSSLSNYSR